MTRARMWREAEQTLWHLARLIDAAAGWCAQRATNLYIATWDEPSEVDR